MKKIIFILLVLVLVIFAFLFIKNNLIENSNQVVSVADNAEQPITDVEKNENISYLIKNVSDPEFKYYDDKVSIDYVSKNGDKKVSFLGLIEEARNPGSYIYLNNEKIGESDGVGVLGGSFSGNNKYFIFRTVGIIGAQQMIDYSYYFVDIENKSFKYINYPKISEQDVSVQSDPFIESFDWVDDDSIKIRFFFVEGDNIAGQTYRVSPVEVWQYNLDTDKYTYIETLPEEGN